MRQPWERQIDAGEGEEAFACFAVYRDLGPLHRSVTAVARECHRLRGLVGRWSSRWAWVERAGAWDAYLDQQRVDEHVEAIREMARRHAQAADLMVAMLLQRATTLVSNQQVDQIPVGAMPRWLDVAVRVGRLARGASTEILAPQGPAAQEAGGRTLGELFVVPDGMTELDMARAVVERANRPTDGEDLDAELAELLDLAGGEESEEDPDDTAAGGSAAVFEPDPAPPDSGSAPESEPEPTAELAAVDEHAEALRFLREHPRRPPAGDELVAWLRARKVVGLDRLTSLGCMLDTDDGDGGGDSRWRTGSQEAHATSGSAAPTAARGCRRGPTAPSPGSSRRRGAWRGEGCRGTRTARRSCEAWRPGGLAAPAGPSPSCARRLWMPEGL